MKLILMIAAGVGLLCLLALFLTAPNFRRRGGAWAGVRFAHRGLHDASAPENSLAAFKRACDAGYGIELDVQLTRDGEIVVFHDPDLMRVCGINRRLREFTLEELRAIRLEHTDACIPTLDEVLALVNGRVPLLVEFKTVRKNGLLCRKACERLRRYPGKYVMESFNPLILFWFRRNAPEVLRGLLLSSTADFKDAVGRVGAVLLSKMLLNALARPDFIAYNAVEPGFRAPERIRRLYRPLMAAWTLRDAEQERRLHENSEITIFENFLPEDGPVKTGIRA